MVYDWKPGSRISADPQKVGEELAKIQQRDAAMVVKVARKSKGELHKCFTWDDSEAASAYRMNQARLILRMVIVIEEPTRPDDEPITYRAFESVSLASDEPKAMIYMPTRQALSNPDTRIQIMARLERTIAEAENTAETYSTIVPALKVTKQKLTAARESVRV